MVRRRRGQGPLQTLGAFPHLVGRLLAATAWGYPAVGLSVPLGNYHNIDDQTGTPAPEYVHLDDVEGMLRLCRVLMAPGLAWENGWKNTRGALKRRARRYDKLLDSAG